MCLRIIVLSFSLLLLPGITGCNSSPSSKPPAVEPQKLTTASASPSVRTDTFDPCSLITPGEIAEVVGHPVKETKGTSPTSNQTSPSFQRWQCFYAVEPFDKSVSLELAQNNPSGSRTAVSEFWTKKFKEAKHEKESEEEDEQGLVKPRSIQGIGEEAFWVGDNKIGALYVLKNKSYLRVSIGGPEDESVKIKKSTSLAQHALRRL